MQLQTGEKNKILRTVSKPIYSITGDIRKFAAKMLKSMDEENGVGLAAPQVGRNIRLIVCKLNPGEKNELNIPMVNPAILQASKETAQGEEGCLSLPGVWGKVTRPKSVLLRFKNLRGQEQTLELNDFNARIVQHEIDHLDGVLFTDVADEVQDVEPGEDAPHI